MFKCPVPGEQRNAGVCVCRYLTVHLEASMDPQGHSRVCCNLNASHRFRDNEGGTERILSAWSPGKWWKSPWKRQTAGTSVWMCVFIAEYLRRGETWVCDVCSLGHWGTLMARASTHTHAHAYGWFIRYFQNIFFQLWWMWRGWPWLSSFEPDLSSDWPIWNLV